MSAGLVAIAVFVVGAVVYALISGRSSGTLLALGPGETRLIDEEPVRVESGSRRRKVVYGHCRVTVTEHRILIAQRPLFGKTSSVPRYLITLADGGEHIELAASLKQAAVQFTVPRSAISIEHNGSTATVVVPIPESMLTWHERVTFRTSRASEFASLLA
ncbi:MAG TPA: hypothetical protein VMW87_04775 [Spirochaetia bacterium]|nr:hypothetical protein [Spirochaetia bacterium]